MLHSLELEESTNIKHTLYCNQICRKKFNLIRAGVIAVGKCHFFRQLIITQVKALSDQLHIIVLSIILLTKIVVNSYIVHIVMGVVQRQISASNKKLTYLRFNKIDMLQYNYVNILWEELISYKNLLLHTHKILLLLTYYVCFYDS